MAKIHLALLLITLSFAVVINSDEGASETATEKRTDLIGKAEETIDHVKTALEAISSVASKANLGKNFMKISNILANLGPVFMAVSAVFSIISIFMPQAESEQLKAIKEGFENVNNKLDSIEDSMEELKLVIQISSAKTSLLKSVDSIEVIGKELKIAQDKGTGLAWEYFVRRYENEYGHSADNIYRALAGRGDSGDYRFDLLMLYRDKFKCSVNSISRICLVGMQILNKGLAIEAAYLGAIKYPARVKLMREVWKRRLFKLRARCAEVINDCQSNFSDWAEKIYSEYYNNYIKVMEPKQFADGLVKLMEETMGHRKWACFISDPMGQEAFKYGDHIPDSVWSSKKINHNGKNMVLMSVPEDHKCDDSLKTKVDEFDGQVKKMVNCQATVPGPLYYDSTKPLCDSLATIVQNTAYLGGPTKMNAQVSMSVGSIFQHKFEAWCLSEPHTIFAFC